MAVYGLNTAYFVFVELNGPDKEDWLEKRNTYRETQTPCGGACDGGRGDDAYGMR